MEFPMIATFFSNFPSFWLSQFCQNLSPFYTLNFSRHLFDFAADFVTLSYTKVTIFLTLFL